MSDYRQEGQPDDTPPNKHDLPTRQELEALRAAARHGTIKAAADALTLSSHTIDAHLDHLRWKSGLRYLPQLVAWAAHNGWLADK